jgi:tRNA threonylcarbamoyladenosine biosynthesis protein TsaB
VTELSVLAIDTSTSRTVVRLVVEGRWFDADTVAPRHGGELLPAIEAAFREAGAGVAAIGGVVVGTGPGSFTGLRVGLAAAKTIAHARSLPIVGIPSAVALAVAVAGEAADELSVLQPAGPADRYVTRVRVGPSDTLPEMVEQPRVLASAPFEPDPGSLVAVDLDGDESIPGAARERGRAAVAGLGGALVRLGVARLVAGERDDVAELTPIYVTLPRGVTEAAAAMTWSPDLR